ncbi:DUF1801 domain-containing protein [Fulvivirgaceae bacterium BMA10]|uniref:DUF1801 domain-containing protein n=1 Tax=Splendidivirga corallicola TaxID=3051826 RepID=A0ABT8L005_9BACT|nr:DUF1801 domain-containing protein [Fulvivirgaceae bacterium BMA10]
MDYNDDVTQFIEKSIDGQKVILEALRELIAESVPDVREQLKWGRPVYASQKDFCYLQTSKNYVTFGFFNFEKVDDPEDLLEGTGKQMRHIKIAKSEDIKSDLFTKMLKQASEF